MSRFNLLRHSTVFFEKGMYAGWPANHGIWSWGDGWSGSCGEILVGFSVCTLNPASSHIHPVMTDKPESHLLARSYDGGNSWDVDGRLPTGRCSFAGSADQSKWKTFEDELRGPLSTVTVRMASSNGPSCFMYSNDRGQLWYGPYKLDIPSTQPILGRTDVNWVNRVGYLSLTEAKSNGREGNVIMARTSDWGRSWSMHSRVTNIREDESGYAIMPSTLFISQSTLLMAVRRKMGRRFWIETYRSIDGGESWSLPCVVVPDTGHSGNPGHLLMTWDARIVLTYAVRKSPFRIAAKVSDDMGVTWSDEMVLRADGGNRDIGYCQSAVVSRDSGDIVTVYYFNDKTHGQERYIGASIWTLL